MAKQVRMNLLDKITGILLIVGGLNWGLEAFNWNLVDWISNLINIPGLSKIVYFVVGISALYFTFRAITKFR